MQHRHGLDWSCYRSSARNKIIELDFLSASPGRAMARAFRFLIVLWAFTLTVYSPNARAAEPVDSLLVLAADVSRSIDQPKFQLQREGYAAAISHPRVLNAIASGLHRRIAVCFVEWSGIGAQKVVIDWTLISDAGSARRFSDQLLEAPRSFADWTSISGAIDFAAALFDRAPYDSTRHTIDVSGDGTNNSGRDVSAARDDAVGKGITINGLVILTPRMRRFLGIQSTPTRPGAWPTTIETTSSAAQALSSSSPRTSTPFRRRSPKR
jgi:hypothetical protein